MLCLILWAPWVANIGDNKQLSFSMVEYNQIYNVAISYIIVESVYLLVYVVL